MEQTQQLIKSTEEEQRAREEAEQANKDLEIKSKEMEQFAYIASHDLQEPILNDFKFCGIDKKKNNIRESWMKKQTSILLPTLEASDRMRSAG